MPIITYSDHRIVYSFGCDTIKEAREYATYLAQKSKRAIMIQTRVDRTRKITMTDVERIRFMIKFGRDASLIAMATIDYDHTPWQNYELINYIKLPRRLTKSKSNQDGDKHKKDKSYERRFCRVQHRLQRQVHQHQSSLRL